MELSSKVEVLDVCFPAALLIGNMWQDKKTHDGALRFVLARGIGQAFTSEKMQEVMMELLRAEECGA